MAMKLKTGLIAFPIEFDNGEKDKIYFNPNDPDLFVRFADFEGKMNNRLAEIKDVELENDGTPKEKALVEMMRGINQAICEELDIAFGNKISDVVFKYCSPFAIVNGEYFLEQFVMAIRPEITKYNEKANLELQKKKQKHIEKYAK
jgi:hypothetical protein